MNDSTISLPWHVIRQDDNGNRYRVGRYATRAEAQKIADSLDARGHKQLYWVERVGQSVGQGQTPAQSQAQPQAPAQAQNGGEGARN
ncbi:SPOR domain-containing protein [Streptomyces sp. NPDC020951]|uniref:SPOR domain-containing protein n=1 Tax=Streptomyces sp. NPDC020951 TaxID=3365104 RepID=UPI0037A46C8A